ncbi:LOG family protein YvdD [compost metagenome]
MINRIAVFCGSSFGSRPSFRIAAYELGALLSDKGFGLVFGGSGTGLMGALADGVAENQGEAIGVLPKFLKEKEVPRRRLAEMIVVEDMHGRKAKMSSLADGFIVLPGGLGTLEEFFEVLTWAQLGLHEKQIVLLNIDGFYDPLILLLRNLEDFGFVRSGYKPALIICESVSSAVKEFEKLRNR